MAVGWRRRVRGLAVLVWLGVLVAMLWTGGTGFARGPASSQYQYGSPCKDSPSASQYQYESRPGWGCGNKNHSHTGPPGK